MESGCVSKVPMQPRRERLPDDGETTFQVTKRGDSVRLERRCEERRGWTPMGRKEAELEDGVEAAVEGEREEEEDAEAGVEEPLLLRELDSRWRVGLRGAGREEDKDALEGSASDPDGGSSSSDMESGSSSFASSSSRPFG